MKTKPILILTFLGLLLVSSTFAVAGERLSDAAIKQKLLGYWGNARHAYLYKADGVRYMCPRKESTTTNKWNVKNGAYYEDGAPYQIVTLTDKEFAYCDPRDKTIFTYQRQTKKEAEGE